jgi:ATP-dependent exoDNAse (exonuclease V) beta subunit
MTRTEEYQQLIISPTTEAWLPDLPADLYYPSTRLGSSKLKAFTQSPLHYKKYDQAGDTAALSFGRAAHVFVLEGKEQFDKEFVIAPKVNKNTKIYKIWAIEQAGKQIISQKDYDTIVAMREALAESYAAPLLYEDGHIESSLLWTHKAKPFGGEDTFNIPCRGRIDKLLVRNDGEVMLDYKTCLSANPYDIYRQISKFKYWLQEAHFGSGFEHTKKKKTRMIFLFQEKSPPYDVFVIELSNESRELAANRYNQIMNDIAECYINDSFPGQNSSIGVWDFGE